MREAFTFDDVLLIPAYNHYESRQLVDTSVTDRTGKLSLRLPVMTANMDTITESAMANFIGARGGIGVLHRMMSVERNVKEFRACSGTVFVSVGTSEEELERAEALRHAGATHFVVDVAHGHAKYVGKTLKRLRQLLPDACLMAGNVATYAGADYLASVGADIIKVGIGPGSVCTTRVKTGHGVPQLTAIQDCARCDRSIVADGGLRYAGDVVKALAFGADFVMIGGMLAGTRPTPGERAQDADGKWVKSYRGMASREVAEEHHGGIAEWKTAEGVAVTVPYREDEELILADLVGGLRSGLTYAGSQTIKELQRKLNFVQITSSGWRESMPHKLL
ncbi:MAG: guanosine monophosphate reductase [Anaeromyxobacter sp.]|nr:guanosine monophosphate reductase [Anaeromyxobacter sp.]MBL0276703.1 guanosine monophosphate reductase [Anaeromyxobacter sp.]